MSVDHPFIHAALVVGAVVVVVQAGYWCAVWVELLATMRRLPTGRSAARRLRSSEDGRRTERVCVVVPAHNEEAQIQVIARSLLAQTHGRLRVVFALDRCTDGTLARLREVVGEVVGEADFGGEARVTIVEVSQCAEGWAGKSHAIWRAVNDTAAGREAEVLVMVDADTELDPRCIEVSLAIAEERSLDLLSLLSTLTHDAWFERVVQPAAAIELMRQYPIRRANASADGLARRPFANGQFILVRRSAYFETGGHGAICGAILEDVALARLFAEHGKRTGLLLASGMVCCRMYANFEEFCRGWNRIFRESVRQRATKLRAYAGRLRVMSVYLPLAAVLSVVLGAVWLGVGAKDGEGAVGVADWVWWGWAWWALAWVCVVVGVVGVGAFGSLIVTAYALGRSGWGWAVAYPVGSWLVARILDRAAADVKADEPIIWAGRTYHAGSASGS